MSDETGKDDACKPRLDLLPAAALVEVARVLGYGASRYELHGWQRITEPRSRYTAALLRHLFASMEGELYDQESGHLHVAHVAANALFLLWHELRGSP